MPTGVAFGIDLAWGPKRRTGVAVLDDSGQLLASASVVSDDAIVAFTEHHRGDGIVVAVDAPLVVPNESGRRDCEAELSRDFARFHAGTHPSNRSRPWFRPEPRGARLAVRLGLDLDPTVRPGANSDVAIEVYPHPAMVSLFELERVIPYKAKRGRDLESLRAAFRTLFDHMETTLGPVLRLDQSSRWSELSSAVSLATKKSELRLVEDEVDAIFCAYLARLWAVQADQMVVYGDVESGYIVTPHPPSARPSLSRVNSITHRVPELVLTEHTFAVPLDYSDPTGEHIDLFAREVVAADKEGDDLPWLVFLQGGPGFEAPRPLRKKTPPWLERALEEFRVLMLDQRGVGRSSPVGPRDVAVHDSAGLASRLVHFRADSIVRDAERIRRQLGVDSWSVLGQSFGGFCVVTYLSLHPESLDLALVTGGLPPLDRAIDEVYTATYARTTAKVAAHYDRFPEDRGRVERFVHELATHDFRLPDGSQLTHRRFRQLGLMLGMSDGSERLHSILELPTDSPAFRHDVAASLPFSRNPLYAVVHESCYAPGQVTDWSADRVLPGSYADDPTLLTGEHVYPWMFDEYPGLQPFAETAGLLAGHSWGPLYDAERLAANDVPSAALVYAEDMYVERDFSEETSAGIRGMRMWLTNEYEHDGLRADGGRVLGRLLDLARGRA